MPINGYRNIFGSWVFTFEIGAVKIEVTVVVALHHFSFYNVFQGFYVNHIAGNWVNFTGYFGGKGIVVAMVIGIVAGAKSFFVLGITPSCYMQAVGGIKHGSAGYGGLHQN